MTSPSHLKIQGHSLTMALDVNEAITVKSITGLRKMDEFVGGNDIDGGAYEVGGLPFTVRGRGRVPGGEVRIDASRSSQFVSGLLLSAARFDNPASVAIDQSGHVITKKFAEGVQID